MSDTQSTATDYTDSSATVAGETYGYQVKAIRNGVESLGSNVAAAQLPDPRCPCAEQPDGRGSLPRGVNDANVRRSGIAMGCSGGKGKRSYGICDQPFGGVVARFSSLVTDTASTFTEYTDASATTLGETYAYVVFALRGTENEPGVQPGRGANLNSTRRTWLPPTSLLKSWRQEYR